MFAAGELSALVVGSRFVRALAGTWLAESARFVLLKIAAVLPPELHERSGRTRIFAPLWDDAHGADFATRIDHLQAAIIGNQVLRLQYRDEAGGVSTREAEPLCLSFRGDKWTPRAWCRRCQDLRNFCPGRIDVSVPSGEVFAGTAAHSAAGYRRVGGASERDMG